MTWLGSCRLLRIQKYLLFLLFASFICGMILGITLVTDSDVTGAIFKSYHSQSSGNNKLVQKHPRDVSVKDRYHDFNNASKHHHPLLNKTKSYQRNSKRGHPVDIQMEDFEGKSEGKFPPPNYNIHTFYYPWYGNPEHDGKYLHWNHQFIQHWEKNQASKWPKGRHIPPRDIGATFYPELGAYSSRDPAVLDNHMQQMRQAGIGVLSVSWYPPNQADNEGHPSDDLIPLLLDSAHKYQLKLCFHIEPYEGRDALSLRRHLVYIRDTYGNHPALYRRKQWNSKQLLPLFYIYDSYLVSDKQWASIFRPNGERTVRGTDLDGIFLGLIVEEKHKGSLVSSGFDGYYTYFASDGFTFGSGTHNWGNLAAFARTNNMLFVPSVGPGYDDTRVRPWNAANTKHREHGGYYEQSFKAALGVRPAIVSITSFNEWHEGTQIESAVPHADKTNIYLDYSPQKSNYYLMLTRKFSLKLRKFQQT